MTRLMAKRIYSNSHGDSVELRVLVTDLKRLRLTGLLKTTCEACIGVIIFEKGKIIDSCEIFGNEVLVRDREGTTIIERYKAERGRIDVYDVHRETLRVLLKTIENMPTQEFQPLQNFFLK
jgi:hypothetical protein